MEQLKTIKDFRGWDIEVGKEELGKHISVYELKIEALKWIKELDKCSKEDGSCNHNDDDHYFFGDKSKGDALSQQECVACRDLFKHFFNEEDLKEC